MRIRAIDNFRGLSILLMVFFSIICRLGNDLPDQFVHNVPFSVHLGDFVLPMFLFASGMSIVFFVEKRKGKKRNEYWLDVIERFGMLAGVAILLSPFSGGGMFEMDELMLSALLFVPTVILIGFSEVLISGIAILVFVLYFALLSNGMLPNFVMNGHYLGGYGVAIFYLPVMLFGVIAAKLIGEIKKLFAIALVLSIILIAIIPPYKMSATPSFMMLSVAISLGIFVLLDQIKNVKIEILKYLGRKPLRYWILMFVVLIAPIDFYAIGQKTNLPLGFEWVDALLLSIGSMVLIYAISLGIDWVDRKKFKALI